MKDKANSVALETAEELVTPSCNRSLDKDMEQ